MQVTFRIRRFNPEVPGKNKPYWQEFTLDKVEPNDRVLELLHDEMTRAMGLLGVNTLAELNPSYLRAAPPVRVPHVLSAFPYIDAPDDRY